MKLKFIFRPLSNVRFGTVGYLTVDDKTNLIENELIFLSANYGVIDISQSLKWILYELKKL